MTHHQRMRSKRSNTVLRMSGDERRGGSGLEHCSFVTIVLVSTLLVFVLPEEYTARVRLEVMRDSQTYEVFSENAVKDDRSSEDHAAFMRNEVLKMTSKETLYNVIEELRLEKVLEEEHSPGGAYEMLLERLEVNSLPGSSMVDIKVHHSGNFAQHQCTRCAQ